ncbi:MAG: bifunctional glutamate N-acetyltransferase/amino-acid acetyltransferase ArgJ [Dehalococcoidia bacterium]|nr:MAG: bifunctional glutamate N-acetyltransferase/amino-acid acetyltransferase ArgJ [Dehalococcoidia bacterium]
MPHPTPEPAGLVWIEGGHVTTPTGFVAGGAYAGIKTYGDDPRLDIGILGGEGPLTVAGIFTKNAVTGISVTWDKAILAERRVVRGLVCNSGNANTVTGDQGERDCAQMAALAAARLGCDAREVLVGSTGVIGRLLPMDKVERGLSEVALTSDGGLRFARAIMTTDTHEKQFAAQIAAAGRTYTVGGCAKGAGMIHPDMATMFAFLTTDAPADPAWLEATLRDIASRTYNMIDVDMDTSTSDTALILASGLAGGEPLTAAHPAAAAVAAALEAIAGRLARGVARDAEGATCLIEAVVEGAASVEDARLVARTITSSPLIKTMVTGRDPNWGRVMMAAGRSGARFEAARTSVWIGDNEVLHVGQPTSADLGAVSRAMAGDDVQIRIHLGAGNAVATAWGCNLTAEYVSINADYTT